MGDPVRGMTLPVGWIARSSLEFVAALVNSIAVDSLQDMAVTDASMLENWFPSTPVFMRSGVQYFGPNAIKPELLSKKISQW